MIGQQQFAVFYQFKLCRGWGKRERGQADRQRDRQIKLGSFGKK
jgi:hypothetical protein